MALFETDDRRFLTALSRLAYCNPFHPDRIELERAALGDDFEPDECVAWSRTLATAEHERPNVVRLTQRADRLADRVGSALAKAGDASEQELSWYEDLVFYVLYYRWLAKMSPAAQSGHKTAVASVWRSFLADFERFFARSAQTAERRPRPEHLFACLHQLRRAFRQIFDCILGESMPAAELRGKVWQSIFTHDMRRYRRGLYDRMADVSTLVTGPSGTGKELVARAIARAQYVPFDSDSEALTGKPDEGFVPLNLSALSPTLIESELFGHCRGSFTGAAGDRVGWLESCPPHGAVFLDEIGELDPAIQVKLLRVVQNRAFNRLGETGERRFAGKLIAATNRDLNKEIEAGRFRGDLYYRLCADRVETPTLRAQIADRPEELPGLVRHIARRVAGEEADALAEEVEAWVRENLAPDYPWPGNIRELEQCVRSVLVRGDYTPRTTPREASSQSPGWLAGVDPSELTADGLVRRYCTAVYAELGSYEQTAKRLGLDRRTVRAKVDADLLDTLRGNRSEN